MIERKQFEKTEEQRENNKNSIKEERYQPALCRVGFLSPKALATCYQNRQRSASGQPTPVDGRTTEQPATSNATGETMNPSFHRQNHSHRLPSQSPVQREPNSRPSPLSIPISQSTNHNHPYTESAQHKPSPRSTYGNLGAAAAVPDQPPGSHNPNARCTYHMDSPGHHTKVAGH